MRKGVLKKVRRSLGAIRQKKSEHSDDGSSQSSEYGENDSNIEDNPSFNDSYDSSGSESGTTFSHEDSSGSEHEGTIDESIEVDDDTLNMSERSEYSTKNVYDDSENFEDSSCNSESPSNRNLLGATSSTSESTVSCSSSNMLDTRDDKTVKSDVDSTTKRDHHKGRRKEHLSETDLAESIGAPGNRRWLSLRRSNQQIARSNKPGNFFAKFRKKSNATRSKIAKRPIKYGLSDIDEDGSLNAQESDESLYKDDYDEESVENGSEPNDDYSEDTNEEFDEELEKEDVEAKQTTFPDDGASAGSNNLKDGVDAMDPTSDGKAKNRVEPIDSLQPNQSLQLPVAKLDKIDAHGIKSDIKKTISLNKSDSKSTSESLVGGGAPSTVSKGLSIEELSLQQSSIKNEEEKKTSMEVKRLISDKQMPGTPNTATSKKKNKTESVTSIESTPSVGQSNVDSLFVETTAAETARVASLTDENEIDASLSVVPSELTRSKLRETNEKILEPIGISDTGYKIKCSSMSSTFDQVEKSRFDVVDMKTSTAEIFFAFPMKSDLSPSVSSNDKYEHESIVEKATSQRGYTDITGLSAEDIDDILKQQQPAPGACKSEKADVTASEFNPEKSSIQVTPCLSANDVASTKSRRFLENKLVKESAVSNETTKEYESTFSKPRNVAKTVFNEESPWTQETALLSNDKLSSDEDGSRNDREKGEVNGVGHEAVEHHISDNNGTSLTVITQDDRQDISIKPPVHAQRSPFAAIAAVFSRDLFRFSNHPAQSDVESFVTGPPVPSKYLLKAKISNAQKAAEGGRDGKINEAKEDIPNSFVTVPNTQNSSEGIPLLDLVESNHRRKSLTTTRSCTNKPRVQEGRSTTGSFQCDSLVTGLGNFDSSLVESIYNDHVASKNSENVLKSKQKDVRLLNPNLSFDGQSNASAGSISWPEDTSRCKKDEDDAFADEVRGTSTDLNPHLSNQEVREGTKQNLDQHPTRRAQEDILPLTDQTNISVSDTSYEIGKEVLLADVTLSDNFVSEECKKVRPHYRVFWARKKVDSDARKLDDLVYGARAQPVGKWTTARPQVVLSNQMSKVKRIWGVKKYNPLISKSIQSSRPRDQNMLSLHSEYRHSSAQADDQCREYPLHSNSVVLSDDKETMHPSQIHPTPTFIDQNSPNENKDGINSILETKGSQTPQQAEFFAWYCTPCKDSNSRASSELMGQPDIGIYNTKPLSIDPTKPVTLQAKTISVSPTKTVHPCIEVNLQPQPSPEKKKTVFGIFTKVRNKKTQVSRVVNVTVEQPDSIEQGMQLLKGADGITATTGETGHITKETNPSNPPSAPMMPGTERQDVDTITSLKQTQNEEELMTLVPVGLLIKMISDEFASKELKLSWLCQELQKQNSNVDVTPMLQPFIQQSIPSATANMAHQDELGERKHEPSNGERKVQFSEVETKELTSENIEPRQPYQSCFRNNDHQWRKESNTTWALANVLTSPSESGIEGLLSGHVSTNSAAVFKNGNDCIGTRNFAGTNEESCLIPFPVSAFTKLVNCDGATNAKDVLQEHLTVDENTIADSTKRFVPLIRAYSMLTVQGITQVDFDALDGDVEVTLSDQPEKGRSEPPPPSMTTESLRILSIMKEAIEIEVTDEDPKSDMAPLIPVSTDSREKDVVVSEGIEVDDPWLELIHIAPLIRLSTDSREKELVVKESEGFEVDDPWLELIHENTDPSFSGTKVTKTFAAPTSLEDRATDENTSCRIALKAVSNVKVPEITDVLAKGTANRYYDKEIEKLEIANINEKKKSSNVVEEKKSVKVAVEDVRFNTTIQGILRKSTSAIHRSKQMPMEQHGYDNSDCDPNIPSHLAFQMDDDFDGSTLTSSQTRKILEADNATQDSLSIGVAAWKEIYEASKVVESALKKFEMDDDDTRSKLSLDENVMEKLNSIDHIEAALEILKIHAERLGVKESDLLVAVKTDYDEEEEEEFEERSMTLGEEIFEALKSYGLFGGSKNKKESK